MGAPNPEIVVEPATEARFDDLAAVLGPKKNPQGTACWCLSHRLPAAENQSLTGPARGARVRELTRQDVAPGVLAYVDGQVAGWAATAPRRELPFSRSRKIPQVDDLDVWVVWCVRVQPGFRRQGLAATLVRGVPGPATATPSARDRAAAAEPSAGRMGIDTEVVLEPATEARFDDLAAVLGPKKNPQATVCWCLSHRLPAAENQRLAGPARGARVRELTRQDVAPGVLAYVDGRVAGWAATGPRRELPFSRSRKIPQVDDLDVWVVWCVRVQPGFRRRGLTVALVRGAADYALSQGAPAVEGYPVDNGTARVDQTMAYVGTRAMFERAGFHQAAGTESVSGGFPRVVMRLAPV